MNNTATRKHKILNWLGSVLGAGAIGACPLCWAGSAALLTYVGLGALVPAWPWLIAVLLAVGLVGLAFDWRSHRNWIPIAAYVIGAVVLFVGRYVLVAPGFGYWYI